MIKARYFFIVSMLLLSAQLLFTQEVQVPIDNENKINVIDKEMESKLALFTEYPDFIDAKLFQLTDSSYILEIQYKVDERLMRQRKNLSKSEADNLRIQVTNCIKEKCPVALINQEGRSTLLWGTTFLGLYSWDWMVPSIINSDNSSVNVFLGLTTAAMSFFIPYLLTDNAPVSDAAANLSITGGLLGIFHGMFLYGLLNDYDYDFFYDTEPTNYYLLTLAMSIGETFGGYYLATSTNMTEGKASMLSGMSAFGIGYGFGIPYIFGADDSKVYFASALLGSGAGFFFGNMLANGQNYTVGDASMFSTLTFLGAYTGLVPNIIAETGDGEIVVASMLAGATAGIILGDNILKGKDFTKSQGTMTAIGTLAGGLMGGAIGYLLDDATEGNGKITMLMSCAGAITTFGIMFNHYSHQAQIPENRTSLEFLFSPEGYTFSNMNKGKDYFNPKYYPVFSLKYNF
ncbi:MAG: hypothetical protein A2X61_01940 [Ignavibacteria bacterium GWB2_35_12]|nr:MAG: hypothetical protein A2X63_01250 [Ignavibacteria bacterium GWA2_35_8]OGU40013.1 MAG: hypothetical protein A2X61_01940 [Ignavibacteria bacterium GWB2_35_12]OGU86930.1 MAG: hypothetical protein A2220_12395 [Ignavibacteria bacterium RIFOXYA2_FULL_35_10]OGV21973.1 MAG: hypothetical protein A2475_08080 [Ignavibacteria bacterium RIFOXYC2_FULL_35_21]